MFAHTAIRAAFDPGRAPEWARTGGRCVAPRGAGTLADPRYGRAASSAAIASAISGPITMPSIAAEAAVKHSRARAD